MRVNNKKDDGMAQQHAQSNDSRPDKSRPDRSQPDKGAVSRRVISKATARGYWRANLRILVVLLSIWGLVAFGLSIFLVDELNKVAFFGFKLGFWWAQQGAIYVFVGLIFAYIFWIGRVEKRFGVGDDESDGEGRGSGP